MRDLFDDENESPDKNGSAEFARMFEESLKGASSQSLSPGDKIRGEILTVGKEEAFVSTGTIDDGVLMKSELLDDKGEFPYKVGDFLDLYVLQVKGGQIRLSTKPTSKNLADGLEDAYNMMVPVEGRVTEAVNGGFRVQLMGSKLAFCPMSHIDSRRVEDQQSYVGRKFEFLITKFERGGRDIVVSRRKLLDDQKEQSQAMFAEDHKPGDIVSGVITRLEKFGAFVEIAPGLEGLCHISELAWSRVADPSEVVRIGQEVQSKILKVEEGMNGRMNVSLSIKQAGQEPWESLPSEIREGEIIEGRVTKCLKFGAFVELAPGIEGLVPLSEMSYTKRVVRSDEMFKEGERILVLIKEIRADERRLLLSYKDAAGGDPWSMVEQKFPQGAVVRGRVERREPYGLFVKIDEGVTGLLPKSKGMEVSDFPYDKLKLGDEVTVQVSEVRVSERRISLGVPSDPDADAWRGSSQATSGAKLGTLGDQFKNLFTATTQQQQSLPNKKK